jgi:hypothetical protein
MLLAQLHDKVQISCSSRHQLVWNNWHVQRQWNIMVQLWMIQNKEICPLDEPLPFKSLRVWNIHGVRKHILPINLGCSKDTCCRNKLKYNKISLACLNCWSYAVNAKWQLMSTGHYWLLPVATMPVSLYSSIKCSVAQFCATKSVKMALTVNKDMASDQ